MSRIARDSRLETVEARKKLKQRHQPYWRTIHPGLSIGYRKGPRGWVWQVRYRKGTEYKFGTIGTADDIGNANNMEVMNYKQAHKLALNYADQHEAYVLTQNPIAGHYTVGQALDDYLEHFKLRGKSYMLTTNITRAHIRPTFEERVAERLTSREIEGWHERLASAPARIRGITKTRIIDPGDAEGMRKRKATANRILTILKAALNYAYERGNIKSADEWRRVKPFREVDAPKIRHLSEDDCARILNACSHDLRDLVMGALQTGCRFGELANMVIADYSPDSGTVTVQESKGGKPRHVPLTQDGRELFERLTTNKNVERPIFTRSDGNAWAKNHYTRPFRDACKRAGITPAVSFHILRHTYGSLLAARGVPLQVIATVMGHADTRMTERHYAHLIPSFVADTVRANLPSFTNKVNTCV